MTFNMFVVGDRRLKTLPGRQTGWDRQESAKWASFGELGGVTIKASFEGEHTVTLLRKLPNTVQPFRTWRCSRSFQPLETRNTREQIPHQTYGCVRSHTDKGSGWCAGQTQRIERRPHPFTGAHAAAHRHTTMCWKYADDPLLRGMQSAIQAHTNTQTACWQGTCDSRAKRFRGVVFRKRLPGIELHLALHTCTNTLWDIYVMGGKSHLLNNVSPHTLTLSPNSSAKAHWLTALLLSGLRNGTNVTLSHCTLSWTLDVFNHALSCAGLTHRHLSPCVWTRFQC